MIYFFNSTNKKDKIKHPILISTKGGINKAYALAVINFVKHSMIGSPKLIQSSHFYSLLCNTYKFYYL